MKKECSKEIIGLGAKVQNAQRLLEELYNCPIMTISEIAQKLNITLPTAKNLALDLVNLNIVESCNIKIQSEKLKRKHLEDKFMKMFIKLLEYMDEI